jgi:hypothetical protein
MFFMNKFKGLLVLFLLIFSTFSFNLKEVSADMIWQKVLPVEISSSGINYPSLVIDGNNKLYVAFSDGANSNKATVMTYNGTSWETVGSAGFSANTAYLISLAIDGNNKLYVVFRDGANVNKATVMTYNNLSGEWETVGSAGFSIGSANSPSLAIDVNNKLYVSFSDGGNSYKATTMTYNNLSGEWETVGSAGFSNGSANYTSLDIDGNNKLYVAFSDGGNSYKVTTMTYNDLSGEWEAVGSSGFSNDSANYTSLAIDGNNKLYVAFQDEANINSATVMTYNDLSGEWEAVGSSGFSASTAYLTSLAIDGNNKLYVSFSDNTDGDKITVMTYNGTNWETVGSAGFSNGIYTSLATDGDNKLYIAFGDEGNGYKATVMVYDSYTPPETPTFAGGTGTEGDPYQISTCQQLQDINFISDFVGTHPFLSGDDYFILTNDIDCSETSEWNDGAGFEPIGNNDEYPDVENISDSIHLDGNNKTISNLYINRPNKMTVGLFSLITDSEIKDLTIEGDFTGVIVGMVSSYTINTNIINCHTSGNINSVGSQTNSAGGILGVMIGDSSVSKSSSSATIESNFSGGLVGTINGGTISDSYYNGNIIDGLLSGGLIGFYMPDTLPSIPIANFNIINSYSTGNINGAIVGGLAGILFDVSLLGVQISISDSYSTSEITNTPNSSVFDSLYGSMLGFDENSKYTGGLIGGFVSLQPMGVNSENIINTFIHNSGWYKTESNTMSDIGAYGYFGGGLTIEGQNKDVSNIFTESDNTLFYSKSHGVYAQGQVGGWDFETPVWYEQSNDYPKFVAYASVESPTLTTTSATSVTKTNATLNGEITDNDGEDISELGFQIGLDTSYTMATGTVEIEEATGTFSYDLTGLTCNTTYHYRAYATNSAGTGYGNDMTFTTAECPKSRSRVIGSINPSTLLGKKSEDLVATNPEIKNPITTPSFSIIYTRLLKQGLRGDDIKQIQSYLTSKGYILGLADGIFGPKTKQAVIAFQKANGLTPDGLIGKLTIAKMNELK